MGGRSVTSTLVRQEGRAIVVGSTGKERGMISSSCSSSRIITLIIITIIIIVIVM